MDKISAISVEQITQTISPLVDRFLIASARAISAWAYNENYDLYDFGEYELTLKFRIVRYKGEKFIEGLIYRKKKLTFSWLERI